MNREIMFRAWDGNNIIPFSEIIEKKFNVLFEWTHHLTKVKLMQYTGLKDKNGVEIYEGDIVEYFTEQDVVDGKIIDKRIRHVETVKFCNGAFCFDAGDEVVFGIWLWETEPNVIGNIHQNPELL